MGDGVQIASNAHLTFYSPSKSPFLKLIQSLFTTINKQKRPNPPGLYIYITMAKLSHEQQLELKAKFQSLDLNGNGRLEQSEVANCLKGMGLSMTDDEITAMVAEFDTDSDGKLSYMEFLNLMS